MAVVACRDCLFWKITDVMLVYGVFLASFPVYLALHFLVPGVWLLGTW